MWRRNILHKRREEVRTNLTEKLFFLDPVFCPVILQHRRICKEIENYRLVNLSTGLTSASGSETLTLQEFKRNQAIQREFVGNKIQEASNISRVKFRHGINAILDELRMRINEFNNEDPSGANGEEDEANHKNKMMFTAGGKGMLEGAAKEKRGMS